MCGSVRFAYLSSEFFGVSYCHFVCHFASLFYVSKLSHVVVLCSAPLQEWVPSLLDGDVDVFVC